MDGWIVIGIAWLVAPIGLLIALLVSRSRSRRQIDDLQRLLESQPVPEIPATPESPGEKWLGNLSAQDIKSLLVLDVELARHRQNGDLNDAQYAELRAGWDMLWTEQLGLDGVEPDSDEWRTRRDLAWQLLVEHQPEPPSIPPWRQKEELDADRAQEAASTSAEPIEDLESIEPTDELVFDLDTSGNDERPEVAEPSLQPPPVTVAARISNDTARLVDSPEVAPAPIEGDRELLVPARPAAVTPTPASKPVEDSFSFTVVEPGMFERLVETVSGWPKLAAPFLVQNIGWFVGAFCFIAGTIFLVSYTTGFANALAVLGSLAVYTGLMLWAGFQMRKRRVDLRISSDVLLAIAMLLCPLNLTAATRLINLASATPGLLVIAILAAAAVVAGVYFAAMLAGGLMDRSLDRRHAQFFVALSSIQLLVPWIGQVTHWYWLAAAHLILLGLLGGALFAFANEWVRSIFVDRRRMAYYTAGLLVFAAVVSFAHLTWSYSGPLPGGYAAPFLMALSGLLFFVDAALKAWVRQHVYLSRFTFALYGVSVVALLLSWQTDLPQLLTLILGAAIYGFVLFRYLSAPPMYLLLACLGWLYADLVLEMLPRDWHLLASLPPLGVLFWGGRGLASRAPSLAQICMWTLLAGFAGLTGWTLLGSEPGWLAFLSALTATGFVRFAGRGWPVESQWVDEQGDFPRWRYLVALLTGLSVVYAPSLIGELQLSFGLVGLAAVWTLLGLHGRRVSRESLESYTNSALIAVALSVAFSVYVVFQQSFSSAAVITLYVLIAVVVVRLSLGFMARWLFYVALAAVGVSGVLTKTTYFAGPSFGLTEFVVAVAIWVVLWWLQRSNRIESELGLEPATETESIEAHLLWTIPVERSLPQSSGLRGTP